MWICLQCRRPWFYSWVGTIPWKRDRLPTGGSDSKASVYNAGDLGSIPGSGRFPGEGNGNPLQYSCLENPMDGGAWFRQLSMGSQRVGHNWVTSLSLSPTPVFLGFPGGSADKRIHLQRGRPGFALWVGKIPWIGEQLPTPVFWPREFHGLHSPWGGKESDRTEWLSLSLFGLPWWLSCKESSCNERDLCLITGLGRSPGEGNGYPLQYSGLENSMDCIVHGVTKSQTRLEWLSLSLGR